MKPESASEANAEERTRGLVKSRGALVLAERSSGVPRKAAAMGTRRCTRAGLDGT